MRVLVTGGAGFIGSNLVRELARRGEDVTVLDDLSTGSAGNLTGLPDTVRVETGDVRDAGVVRSAARRAEVLYHLAAVPSVARSVIDPITTHRVNVDGTLTVLEAARSAGVRRVVYASSSSVYGDTPVLPKDEGMPPAPMSPYAASKLAGEAYCRAYGHVFGVQTVSLRFFNVFGPRQDPASEYAAVVPRFITRMLAGERPEVFGDGRQSRDFTFVGNVVQACVLAATAPEASGHVVNVGCGESTSLVELVDIINDLLGTSVEPTFSAPRPGDVRHSQASISRAGDLLGYRPAMSVREGLAETVRWFSELQGGRRDARTASGLST